MFFFRSRRNAVTFQISSIYTYVDNPLVVNPMLYIVKVCYDFCHTYIITL